MKIFENVFLGSKALPLYFWKNLKFAKFTVTFCVPRSLQEYGHATAKIHKNDSFWQIPASELVYFEIKENSVIRSLYVLQNMKYEEK